ncbi:hypothetical protein Dimus_001652 [Dionaea muscipula]
MPFRILFEPMVALIKNRKRADECSSVNTTSRSSTTRKYLDPIDSYFPKKQRVLHKRQWKGEHDGMRNLLSSKYKETLRFIKKVFCVEDKGEEVISEDSIVEEVGFVEHVSGDRGQFLQGGNGLLEAAPRLERELVEDKIAPASPSEVSDNSEVEDRARVMSSCSPRHYRKLQKTAAKRNPILSGLQFLINVEVKSSGNLLFWWNVKKPRQEEDSLCEPFVPLTAEEEDEVERAFNSNRKKVLVSHEGSNIQITGELLRCLRPGAWLNDEVINLYLNLLKERERREPKKFLKCHFFSTFFYKKLIGSRSGYDYKSVHRWTTQKKLGYGLIDCEKIFVPIHQEMHWCLGVINKKDQKFQYLDSLGGTDPQVLKVLAKYYVDEVKDKNALDIDVSSWQVEYVKDLPGQDNQYDCGMFMIKYIDFYSRGLELQFSQKHMRYFRHRITMEILRLRAD